MSLEVRLLSSSTATTSSIVLEARQTLPIVLHRGYGTNGAENAKTIRNADEDRSIVLEIQRTSSRIYKRSKGRRPSVEF